MALETCGSCGEAVPFDDTVHVLVHTRGDAGVVDHYVCRACYEQEFKAIFEPEE